MLALPQQLIRRPERHQPVARLRAGTCVTVVFMATGGERSRALPPEVEVTREGEGGEGSSPCTLRASDPARRHPPHLARPPAPTPRPWSFSHVPAPVLPPSEAAQDRRTLQQDQFRAEMQRLAERQSRLEGAA